MRQLGERVTLKAGTRVGARKLKVDTAGQIARIDETENGTPMYAVALEGGLSTVKGSTHHYTWVTETEIVGGLK